MDCAVAPGWVRRVSVDSMNSWWGVRDDNLQGNVTTYQKLAQWSSDDGVNVKSHVLGVLVTGLGLPVLENLAISGIDFLHVVIHVLNEQDVVVECFLVFWVTLALRSHDCG